MATSRIQVTEGSGANIATNSFSEDAVTKQLQRTVINDSSGSEKGTASNPIVITSSTLAVASGVSSVFQAGTWFTSVMGQFGSDQAYTAGDKGFNNLLLRNDNIASVAGANLEYVMASADSAGRTLTKPYAADEARVFGTTSVVNTSITSIIPAAGAGLRNYITDIAIANTGSVATLVTFRDGNASVIARTIAPATGGSNLNGMATPIRTGGQNQQIDILAGTASSVLYVTAWGYRAP